MTWSLFFCGFSTNPGLLMDKPDADLRFSTKIGLLMDKRYCELCFSMKMGV